jgi:hypothetical protein
MKGVVFTEFIEFIEDQFGFETVDAMIEKSGQSGVYTQAENYTFEELAALVIALSEILQTPLNTLLEAYGKHLFTKLVELYPNAGKFTSSFDIIANVDKIIHPEVKKLYPDADLPSFNVKEKDENRMVLQYISDKPLHYFARGLMLGAAEHFNENLQIIVHEQLTPVEIEIIK